MLQLFGALPLRQAGPWISASTPTHSKPRGFVASEGEMQ